MKNGAAYQNGRMGALKTPTRDLCKSPVAEVYDRRRIRKPNDSQLYIAMKFPSTFNPSTTAPVQAREQSSLPNKLPTSPGQSRHFCGAKFIKPMRSKPSIYWQINKKYPISSSNKTPFFLSIKGCSLAGNLSFYSLIFRRVHIFREAHF
jgi:hypothetical protein